MENTSVNFRISECRHHIVVWVVLFFLSWSCLPAVSVAQQPTATISTVSGTVLVNGQQQRQGTILNAGDVLETQTGASVVLTLSDGSLLEVGEKTQMNIAELSQTATQARVSRIKLMWGWVRAKLSREHQYAGSSFDIETPNAIIGVKFSQPDVEVSYDPAKQETIGIAHTVELIAINLLTNEKIVVPVGSSVVIIGLIMNVVTGTTTAAIAAGINAAETSAATMGTASAGTATGIGTGTMVVIGVGVLAAAGGVAAVVASSGGDSSSEPSYTVSDLQGSWSFGLFRSDGFARSALFSINSQGNLVEYEGPANLISFNGNFTVSNGSMRGTVSWQDGYDPEQVPCFGEVGSSTLNMQGNFISENRIEGTFTWSVTSTCPSESPESWTGTFTMTR